MPPSQQLVPTWLASLGRIVERIRRAAWDTTPRKLWVVLLCLVSGIALAGAIAAYDTHASLATTSDIAMRLEPLNNNVTRLYQSLAEADATVAAGYLSVGEESNETQARYQGDMVTAATKLAQAGAQAGGDGSTEELITNITTQLPDYTGLVERARANNRLGYAVGVSYLRHASNLMRDPILSKAAQLQQLQAAQLDAAYRRAKSVPIVALMVCLLSLAGLGWAQVFVFRRTHRVFNVGLVLASAAVIAGLVWWMVAGLSSARSLTRASGHSRSVSDALAPAQILALQARALESRELVDRDGPAIEPQFIDQIERLTGNNGAGGALSKAEKFATDQEGKNLVQTAINDALSYEETHQQAHELDDSGQYGLAVDAAVRGSVATAFSRLDKAFTDAISYENRSYQTDIQRAQGRLTDLPIGTAGLALVAVLGVAWGIRQRLKEYQ